MKKTIITAIVLLAGLCLSAQEYKASLFGIKSNGQIDNTASIQRAIDYIYAKGGGTLVFYVGRYLTGAVELKSNVHIMIRSGAVIVGSENIYDYSGKKGIFYAEGQENISVTGPGVIDGRADLLINNLELQKEKGHIPAAQAVPSLLYFKDCKNISLQGLLLRNSATSPDLYIIENSEVKESGCYTDRY